MKLQIKKKIKKKKKKEKSELFVRNLIHNIYVKGRNTSHLCLKLLFRKNILPYKSSENKTKIDKLLMMDFLVVRKSAYKVISCNDDIF